MTQVVCFDIKIGRVDFCALSAKRTGSCLLDEKHPVFAVQISHSAATKRDTSFMWLFTVHFLLYCTRMGHKNEAFFISACKNMQMKDALEKIKGGSAHDAQ